MTYIPCGGVCVVELYCPVDPCGTAVTPQRVTGDVRHIQVAVDREQLLLKIQ